MAGPHLAEAKGADEDWTGLRDPKARRKLQNRLNVRAYRRRRGGATLETTSTVGNLHAVQPVEPYVPRPIVRYIAHLAKERAAAKYDQDALARLSPISRDHLLPLTQYNLMRAMVSLMTILAVDLGFEECRLLWESVPQFPPPGQLPETLLPTRLQLSVPHDRWIDLLPHPRMRDNAIRAKGTFSADDLEEDLLGGICGEGDGPQLHRGDELGGLLVWSDPWRPEGWELTNGFLKNWGFLVVGCDELFRSTNRWRASRGEGPLVIEV